MLRFENVQKKYPDGTLAVENFNMTVEKGEFIVLIGPSGCGKTTTLRMINRLEECTSGKIYINDKDAMSLNPVILRRGIGYVIQERGLMPHHTVAENIATVPNLLGWSKKKIDKRVDELLEMAGLPKDKYKYRLPDQMSGGQQQRIGVLRALAADPDVVLMDEPFGALDPISRESLQNELLELHKKLKKTIVFVTHDINEAMKLADRIVLMRQGKIEQMGTPSDLKNNPINEFVESFLGSEQLSQISPDTPVDSILETPALTAKSSKSVGSVLAMMEEHDVQTAQVINEKGKWCGSLHLSTLIKAQKQNIDRIDRVMSVNRKLYVEEATLKDAAGMLVDNEFNIPIIDKDHNLLGVVSEKGMAKFTISKLIK